MKFKDRPEKNLYYLDFAETAKERSTCCVHFGAIIVKNDQIIATGYNGAPRGVESCLEKGFCMRRKIGIPSGTRYEFCASVHAEMNAIINSARAGVSLLGGDMYIFGEYEGKKITAFPCFICKRIILNAGLIRVICSDPESPEGFKVCLVKDWKEKDMIQDPEIYGKNPVK